MGGIIEEFPFTSLLSIVGLLVGTIIGSDKNIFKNYNFTGIGVNPADFFTEYFSNLLAFVAEGILFGLAVGLLFGFIGLIVDFSRR